MSIFIKNLYDSKFNRTELTKPNVFIIIEKNKIIKQ